jgi:hypothetical protein
MDTVFGEDADYAMLQKIYGADPVAEKRYSPAKMPWRGQEDRHRQS